MTDATRRLASGGVIGPAVALAALLAVAGTAHFVAPSGFDDIVPAVLPGSARFWTGLSGAVELLLALGILVKRTRRLAATAAAVFLPLQIPLIWWAWWVRTRESGGGVADR